MRYRIFVKAIALVLAACCLLVTAVSGFCIVALSQLGLYNGDYAQIIDEKYAAKAENMAQVVANSYAARTYSDMPQSMLNAHDYTSNMVALSSRFNIEADSWSYALYNADDSQHCLESSPSQTYNKRYRFVVSTNYAIKVSDYKDCDYWVMDENGEELYLKYVDGPMLEVVIQLHTQGIRELSGFPAEYWKWAFVNRYAMIVALAAAIVLGGVCGVYLCCAAGKEKKDGPVCPAGLNRLPLDLYAGVVALVGLGVAFVLIEGFESFYLTEDYFLNPGILTIAALLLLGWALLFAGWCYAIVAQVKMKHFYWWRHSAVGWLVDHIFSAVWKIIKGVYHGIAQLIALLPMVGRRILVVLALLFAVFLVLLSIANDANFFALLMMLATIFWTAALFVYDTYGFGMIMRGAKRMAEGDLTTKIPTKYLIGSYKEHAQRLNTIADVATVAAKKQMRSERMKAELITNVSHDIKTPLTSIINYVDLLKKPHTEEEGAQYLEVLDRQSSRMKKLLEDLMEMSKASTGNMNVEMDDMDLGEAVNQALGEFADKLTFAQLIPLFRAPETPVMVMADGRLTWRVLSNILSNVVKYAMPGTRVYLDLVQQETMVQLSIKNISREELNVTADELTERFVRGDASRNTEGNGLGLNIAKSLMELQMGELDLTVDGDLFKVTLTFQQDPADV